MARKRVASKLHQLTVREVHSAPEGELSDGGGLLLRVSGAAANWVLRYSSPTGKRREMGLGAAHRGSAVQAGASLTGARDLAHKARELLRQGIDPIDARDADRAQKREVEQVKRIERVRLALTLARAARDYHARVIEPSRTPKHAAQWISSLENHVPAALWNAPIGAITAPALLSAMLEVKPHERARNLKGDSVPETLRRIRQRLDSVYEDAIFHGHCTSNPAAAIRRKMRETAPKRQQRGAFAALKYKEAPAFMQRLRQCDGTAARCLELAVLTAARTSEALLAEWREFDLDAGIWTLPAGRMKAKEAHAVHLSARALEIVKAQAGQDDAIVFPSLMAPGKPMSNMAMLAVLDRLGVRDLTTVHGLCRATFSTWANETGAARPDVIEACLAHEEGNRVRAAYNRAQFTEERKALLAAWAEYLSRPAAPVVAIEAARAA